MGSINRMYKFKDFRDAYEESKKYRGISKLADFPPYVTFEVTNLCNFRCVMCQATYLKGKGQNINFEIFKKAVDEIASYGSLVRFIGYGEPFLYKDIMKAIEYVKSKGILLHITTNGSMLDEAIAKNVISAGVDVVLFSMQGLSEAEYCAMRDVQRPMYKKIIENMERLYGLRKGKRPYIKITTTITERDKPEDKQAFIEAHLKHADEVQVTGSTHFVHVDELFGDKGIWDKMHVARPAEAKGRRCFVGNYEMLIKADGDVCICCGAFTRDLRIGNVKDDSLFNIWHSQEAGRVRDSIGAGELEKFKDCSVCPIRFDYENAGSTVANTQNDRTDKYFEVK